MPRIRCHSVDCIYLDDGFCTASSVEIDPDMGCATYAPLADALLGEGWTEDEWDADALDLIASDEDDDWLD
jgi:hypothetical protein